MLEDIFPAAFFAVNKSNNHLNAKLFFACLLNSGDGRTARCNNIIDNSDLFAPRDIAFNGAFGAVIFNVFANDKRFNRFALLVRYDRVRLAIDRLRGESPPR